MKILVLGSTGQLAQALACVRPPLGTVVHFLSREQADFLWPDKVADRIQQAAPNVVINAAGFTGVDIAESDSEAAFAVNGTAMTSIAQACTAASAVLVHISTDYVFDGCKTTPYVESDSVNPLGTYGRSKVDGERRVREACERHLILRTAWVYSPFGRNFIKTMCELSQTRDEVRIVSDQVGNPTSAHDLAQAIFHILSGTSPLAYGTYHAAGSGETSWYEFAEEIFTKMERRTGRRPRCLPIPTAEYSTPARRPANSRLDCTKLSATFGVALPHWRDSLGRVLDELNRPIPAGMGERTVS